MKKLLILLLLSRVGFSAYASDRPNMLFIMMDDLGYGHCSFHNDHLTVEAFDPFFKELVSQREQYSPEEALEFSKRAMPSMDRLAREGIVFNRAYAAHSLCAAARLAIANGMNLPQLGVYDNGDVEAEGLEPGTHLAERLQQAGYATAHIGKWHIAKRDDRILKKSLKKHGIEGDYNYWAVREQFPEVYKDIFEKGYYGSVRPEQNPRSNGFDYYYGYNTWASQFYNSTLVWENYEHAGRQSGYNTEVFTDKAVDFIQNQVKEEQPFFVQLHYHAVHDFLQAPAPDVYFSKFHSNSYNLTNFYSHVYAVDYNIQRLIDTLQSMGELENTIIVFTSDNGAMSGGPSVLPGNAPFSGHKGTFNQGGVRVPLVFSWPKGIQEGEVVDHLVSSMDIMPTLLEAAGVEIPKNIDAKSLYALIRGQNETPVRDHMIWSGIHARRWGFLINKSFKNHYTELPHAPAGWTVLKDDYVLRFMGNIEPNLYHEWPEGTGPKFSLYNLKDDVAESIDIKDQKPELFENLKNVYYNQIENYIPPIAWPEEKWKDLVQEF